MTDTAQDAAGQQPDSAVPPLPSPIPYVLRDTAATPPPVSGLTPPPGAPLLYHAIWLPQSQGGHSGAPIYLPAAAGAG